MASYNTPSPFLRGEQKVQERLGVRDIEAWARKVVVDYLPEQHRDFEGAAASLSSRAWKPPKNCAEVRNFCRLKGAISANTASTRSLTTV